MGRFIPHNSEAGRIFNAVHEMFRNLVNQPVTDQYGKPNLDLFDKDDLYIANELLATLERLYDLKLGRSGNPSTNGVGSEEMFREYMQIKHWQRLLNALHGEKAAT